MADSLVLKGVKDIRKQTGYEMKRLNPKRGGDQFQIARWWTPGAKGVVYASCTVLRVSTTNGFVKLVIDTKPESIVKIDHDGEGNFIFSGINELERAALYTDDMKIIEHYAFPAISGGPIMTVIPQGAALRPAPAVVAPPADTDDSDS